MSNYMQKALNKVAPEFEAAIQAMFVPKADGELTHICCCDPGVALCGAKVTGQTLTAVHPEAGKDPCRPCVLLDLRGAKCSDPKCPGPGPSGA